MSLPIKKLLIFDKWWKISILIAVSVIVIASVIFNIIYAAVNFVSVIKIAVIVFSVIALLLAFFTYLRLYKKKKKAFTIFLAFLLCIFLALANTLSILTISGKYALTVNNNIHIIPTDIDAVLDENGIISYNDKQYIYNDNLTTILFMGVDKSDINKTTANGKNGQADALYTVTIDTETGKTTVICISRDTYSDIKIYSKEGNYIRTEPRQLCLAYAYGDGKDMSCENCVWSVSNVLCGIPINTYMSIDFSAISVLNDTVGGVRVPEYTVDWKRKTGKTTVLYGKKAYDYVQYRNVNVTESNAHRITRQIDYLKAFSAKAISKTKEDISTPLKLYNKINSNSVNNLTADKITYLTSVFLKGNMEIEFKNIEGDIRVVGEHSAFFPDSQKLYELVLEVFYKEV